MGWIRSLFGRRSAPAEPPLPFGGGASSYFSFFDLRKNPTAQACINIIANAIAILPLSLYFKDPRTGARQKAGWHPLYSLLKRRPNSSESPTLFLAKLIRHIISKGNAYIFIAREGKEIVALYLLNPELVTETYSGRVVSYTYQGETFTDSQILHIPSLITDDHGKGFAIPDLARAAISLGIQLDEFSLSSFGNGLNTKLLLDISEMTGAEDDLEKLQVYARMVSDYVRRNYAGAENAGKPLVLFKGMKATELQHQASNRDAELLESRKWQEIEICKAFGVPPFLVNGTYEVKYGGLEEAMTVFLNFTLASYLRHVEQRLATLLTPYEQEAYYWEFDTSALLRADEEARGKFYRQLFEMGAISPATISAKENLEAPPEGGDARFVPANLMPLRTDVLDAYMATAKTKAAALVDGSAPPSPASAAGSQAQ